MHITGLPVIILKIFLFGGMLWMALYLLKRGMKLIPSEKALRKKLEWPFLVTKVASWILFTFWCIDLIFTNDPMLSRVFSMLLIFMVVGISWPVIRDFVTGVFIKMEGSYPTNSWIRVRNVEGRIKRMHLRTMEIETEKGETVHIPFSVINKEISVKSNPIESIVSHTFQVSVSKELNLQECKDTLITALMNSHWASLKKEPMVKLLDESNGSYTLRVTAYTVDEKFFDPIEGFVKTTLEKLEDKGNLPAGQAGKPSIPESV